MRLAVELICRGLGNAVSGSAEIMSRLIKPSAVVALGVIDIGEMDLIPDLIGEEFRAFCCMHLPFFFRALGLSQRERLSILVMFPGSLVFAKAASAAPGDVSGDMTSSRIGHARRARPRCWRAVGDIPTARIRGLVRAQVLRL